VKPIKTAFRKETIFSGEGGISKLDRAQSTRLGSLYSCRVPGGGRERLHGMEAMVAFPSNVPWKVVVRKLYCARQMGGKPVPTIINSFQGPPLYSIQGVRPG
jgi:hypothetical protein